MVLWPRHPFYASSERYGRLCDFKLTHYREKGGNGKFCLPPRRVATL